MTSSNPQAIATSEDSIQDLLALPRERLVEMQSAAEEILECYRVLRKGGANIVSEVLKGQGTFFEWNHYPDGDVYDGETHAQYYYHAHRGNEGEHGHFHTFLRFKGMPPAVAPVANEGSEPWPEGEEALSHLIAISMDAYGLPIRLFTTNRWVTGETWYRADDVIAMLDRFVIDHAYPSWPTNRWLTAMFRLYRPDMVELIRSRDKAVEKWRAAHADRDVYEDRDLEITSYLDINVDAQIERIDRALAG